MLEIRKIKKRVRNTNCEFIIVKKNYKIIDVLARVFTSFHLSIKKVIFVNSIQISFWKKYIKFPIWFDRILFPISHTFFTDNIISAHCGFFDRLLHSSALNDEFKFVNKFHFFYRDRFIVRLWLNHYYKKNLNLKKNVILYKKKL